MPYSSSLKYLAITLSLSHMWNGLRHWHTLTLISVCSWLVLRRSITVAVHQWFPSPKLNAAVISFLGLVKHQSIPPGIRPIFLTRRLNFMSIVIFDTLILFFFVVFSIIISSVVSIALLWHYWMLLDLRIPVWIQPRSTYLHDVVPELYRVLYSELYLLP